MERFDIAIIGTGPAGLEAAITAKIRNKNILLLGSSRLSEKIEKTHGVENYLGLPHCTGEEMQKAFLGHLEKMNITITEDHALAVYSMGDYFSLQGHKDIYEASSVILACGMSVEKPFPGEVENLGRGISYCATCDAFFYRKKTVIVVGASLAAEEEALFLSEVASKVIYVPMYEEIQSEKMKAIMAGTNQGCDDRIEKIGAKGETAGESVREESAEHSLQVCVSEKIVSVEKTEQGMVLHLQGKDVKADGIFILRESIAPSQLVPGLEIANNHVTVNRQMETNIPGMFACGDITGLPYQYIKAAGEGNVAALSAVKYLSERKQ